MKLKAFTIVELIVGIVIIGVLAAIALPSYKIQMLKMKNQEAIRILWALWEAEKDYYREKGDYTNNIANLAIDIPPMKNFTNLQLLGSSVQTCGGPLVTYRMSVDSLDSSYRIFMLDNGTIWCRVLPYTSNCPDPLCSRMGFPAQYW